MLICISILTCSHHRLRVTQALYKLPPRLWRDHTGIEYDETAVHDAVGPPAQAEPGRNFWCDMFATPFVTALVAFAVAITSDCCLFVFFGQFPRHER